VSKLAEKSVKDVNNVKDSLMVIDLAAESRLVDLTQDQTNAHKTINAHLLLLMEVANTLSNELETTLLPVLVTVTGITLHTDLSVSRLVLKFAETVMAVKSSLTVTDLAAEFLLVDLTQDQMPAQLTTNVLLPQLMVEPHMSSTHIKVSVWVIVTGITPQKVKSVLKSVPRNANHLTTVTFSLMVIDLVAESPSVVKTQDQSPAQLTTNAHLLLLMAVMLTPLATAQEVSTPSKKLRPVLHHMLKEPPQRKLPPPGQYPKMENIFTHRLGLPSLLMQVYRLDSMLKTVLVTVTGITLHTDL